MTRILKSQAGSVLLLLGLFVLLALVVGAVAYRQNQATKPNAQSINPTQNPNINPPDQPNNQAQGTLAIKEWSVKFSIPSAYTNDLYYELTNLESVDQANGSALQAGTEASFSFKSIVRQYDKCAPYYQRVALLRRTPVGSAYPPPPAEQYTTKFVKQIGGFDYSYILPRQACIEGSFPYHEQYYELYNEFRSTFPALVGQLKADT